MRAAVLLFLLSCLSLSFRADDPASTYPLNVFGYPVDQPLRLSGTFGELRPNHFHSGLDIKGAVGHPVYAAADGYVARVEVSGSGYGRVLFVRHPNGYTTVYAHLNNFSVSLEQYVRENQYREERFAVVLTPDPARFPVRRGDVLGAMGNTGSSFGPHLHFEIRDTESDRPVNPLLFGLEAADTRAPVLQQLRVYELDDEGRTLRSRPVALRNEGDRYAVPGDTISAGSGRVGFGLKVFDQLDGAPNQNGIYALRMFVDDSLVYDFDVETVPFAESRFLNAHVDYAEQVTQNGFFHRCYRLPGNRLSRYRRLVGDGIVALAGDTSTRITLVAADLAGNESRLSFLVRGSGAGVRPASPPSHQYVLPYAEESIIDEYSLNLHFPRGAFYEDVFLQYSPVDDRSAGIYSEVHRIHDYRTPLHESFGIAIRPTLLPDELRAKAFVAYCGPQHRVVNCGGEWTDDGMLRGRGRAFGDYFIMVDDTPPQIEPIAFRPDMRRDDRIAFRVRDDVAGSTLSWRATLNGRWILMEYDQKNDRLEYVFEAGAGPHDLRLVVTDEKGNEAVFTGRFTR